MSITASDRDLTTGQIARHFKVPEWCVVALLRRKLLGFEPRRLGPWRSFSRDQLPLVEAALGKVGSVPAGEVA